MLAVSGCTVLMSDALPDDAGPYEASAADATTNACSTCVAQQCTGAWAVCLTNASCVKLRSCATPFSESKGPAEACFCAGDVPSDGGSDVNPLAAYAAFAACNDARTCGTCSSSCTSACANGKPATTAPSCAASDAGAGDAATADRGDAALPEGPSVDRCSACVAGGCGEAKKLCAPSSECEAFLACAKSCEGDAACADACGKSHASGKAGATELSNCTLTSCRSACGL